MLLRRFLVSVVLLAVAVSVNGSPSQFGQYRAASQRQLESTPNYYRDPRFIFFVPIPTGIFGNIGNGIFGNGLGVLGDIADALKKPCTGWLLSGLRGTRVGGECQDYVSCLVKGGKVVGLCALGAKSCCYNVPEYMQVYTSNSPLTAQKLTFKPASSTVCQVRVDFLQFDINGPDTDGVCNQGGSATFTGQTNTVPPICGDMTRQHIYLTYDSNRTPIMMTVQNSLPSGSFQIKTTQIECADTTNLAPAGCLQYYKETTGTVCSFNYFGGQHLANQDYNVCFDEPSTCTITWDKVPGVINVGVFVPNQYGVANCLPTEDHLAFPNGLQPSDADPTVTIDATLVCGDGTPLVTYTGSLTSMGSVPGLSVFFDGNETPELGGTKVNEGRQGFCLTYNKPC